MIEYQQIRELSADYIQRKIDYYLEEDMPDGDKTTLGIHSDKIVTAYLQAQEDICLAGVITLPYFFKGFELSIFKNDGESVANNEIFAEVTGNAAEILSIERTMLNLIQRLSGIATNTQCYTELASPYGVKILDTRKTTPGLRLFEKYAVVMGGGCNHRLDLSSGILIKDNHIEAAGGITNAINRIREKNFGLPIEVEVENIEQIEEALSVGVDGFLLDNMDRHETLFSVNIIRRSFGGEDIFIESSGGINLNNIGNYLDTGINAISIGALTHTVKGAEIHLEFK